MRWRHRTESTHVFRASGEVRLGSGSQSRRVGTPLGELVEHQDACRHASHKHYESERRDASRYEPEPSRSESPSQRENRPLAQNGTDEP